MPLIFCLSLFGISLYSSFAGGNQLPAFLDRLTPGLQLINTDSISKGFDEAITGSVAQATEFKRANQWRGAVVRERKAAYQQLVMASSTLQQQKLAALDAANAENNRRRNEHLTTLTGKGNVIGYVALGADLLIILCLFFNEHRRWQRRLELSAEQSAVAPGMPIQVIAPPTLQTPPVAPGNAQGTQPRRTIGFHREPQLQPVATDTAETIEMKLSRLEAARKDAKKNYDAWMNKLARGNGREATNITNANKYKSLMHEIEAEIENLKSGAQ